MSQKTQSSKKSLRPQTADHRNMSISEQNSMMMNPKLVIKNAVHVEEQKRPFVANYVYGKPAPDHVHQRVLSAQKRQEIITGITSDTRPLSKVALIKAKIQEINVEQNRRNWLVDRRSGNARIEDVNQAMLSVQADHGEASSVDTKRKIFQMHRTTIMDGAVGEKNHQHGISNVPQPIEEVVKEYKKMKSLMTPSKLMGIPLAKRNTPILER